MTPIIDTNADPVIPEKQARTPITNWLKGEMTGNSVMEFKEQTVVGFMKSLQNWEPNLTKAQAKHILADLEKARKYLDSLSGDRSAACELEAYIMLRRVHWTR
jgi:hypothetical protein